MNVIRPELRERVFPLREDLQLLPGPRQLDGAPCWSIYDPLRNRYFQIGRLAFEMLRRWHLSDAEAIARGVETETPFSATVADVSQFSLFLGFNNLLRGDAMGAKLYARQAQSHKPGIATWMLHNYLFFRIPILKPDRLLARGWPMVRHLYSRVVIIAVLVLAALGAHLILRQWDTFIATFPALFSWQGVVSFGVAMCILKVCHEFGHAFTAFRHGCRVPTMGVAFMVMWPLLYTDTTDAWRLTNRRQRFAIGIAGVVTELSLAALAACLWGFLPDGPARSAAFIVVSSSWLVTLMVNLNPLMRFDAYYLLGDWLGIDNLQPRAFAFGRWWLRELLFGAGLPPPESVARRHQNILVTYAIACWLYRLVVFTGIAVVVYHYFFKAIGLVLFAVEIGWFVVRPITAEIANWWQMRAAILRANTRANRTIAIAALLVVFTLLPIRQRIVIPAVLSPQHSVRIFAPIPARIEEIFVHQGATVHAGDPLLRLAAPDLDQDIVKSQLEMSALDIELRRAAINGQELQSLHVVREKLAAAATDLAALREQQQRLIVTAPIDGTVAEWADALRPGRWVDSKLQLALVEDTRSSEIRGLLSEGDLTAIDDQGSAVFIPNDPFRRRIPLKLLRLSQNNARVVSDRSLASAFGGAVPVNKTPHNDYVPNETVYPIAFVPEKPTAPAQQEISGAVVVHGRMRSPAFETLRAIISVIIRESGF
ncbi:MAG: HlyD family efflux transporter periplasmic adaptor subunit [Rhodospirillaceae bacterium]|nr:MAG: HlyD family efflux transporter periplasmic adaptor subunit [Rhodospirillaceae bacterium]